MAYRRRRRRGAAMGFDLDRPCFRLGALRGTLRSAFSRAFCCRTGLRYGEITPVISPEPAAKFEHSETITKRWIEWKSPPPPHRHHDAPVSFWERAGGEQCQRGRAVGQRTSIGVRARLPAIGWRRIRRNDRTAQAPNTRRLLHMTFSRAPAPRARASDTWSADQEDRPSRAEAIRRLVETRA
jgi:hypothetical protein